MSFGRMWRCGTHSHTSGTGSVKTAVKLGFSYGVGGFIDQLSDYQLLKKD